MTRIALLPSSYPPSLGGVEELSRHLALSLVDAGDQVEVWTGTPDDHARQTAEILDGLLVRRLPMPLPATNWPAVARTATTGRRTVAALRRAAADFEPEVLHVQCFGPNGAYATVLARLAGVPLVVTLQGETVMDDADIFEESRVLRAALRQGLQRAAAVTGCSAFTLADAEARFGLAPGRGRVIPNGVDLDAAGHRSGVRPPRVPGDRPYAFALGRLVAKKGFDLLVDAYAALPDEARTFDMAIAGSGPAGEDLARRIAACGLDSRVHLLGRLSRQEVAATMAAAQFFVMPSRLEPFGIVILEAWRAGVAVVASSRGGAPEFVRHARDGLLVDPFDTDALGAALLRLAQDQRLRTQLAIAGRDRVAAFSWPAVTHRYQEVYEAVVSPGNPVSAPAHVIMATSEQERIR